MARDAARETAHHIIESVSSAGLASSLAAFSSTVAAGGVTLGTGGAALVPMLGFLAVFGGSTWLRCRHEGKRDAEVDARFEELAEVLRLISHNVADVERKQAAHAEAEARLIALLDRVDARQEATPEAIAEALRNDLATLGFDTNDRVREIAQDVAKLLTQQWRIKVQLDRMEAKGDETLTLVRDLPAQIEELIRRHVESQGNEPSAPVLSEADRDLLERAKRSQDDLIRAKAAVVEGDEATFKQLRDRHAADVYQQAYEWAALEGDRCSLQRRYDDAIPHYERALKLKPDDLTAVRDLTFALSLSQRGDKITNCRRAIDILRKAIAAHSREEEAVAWAGFQNNLGAAWCKLPDGDRAANLREAITCYRLALEVFTRADFPTNWSSIQNNLGNALRNLPDGDRSANLREAITCYRLSLEVCTRAASPTDWAMAQNNLGNALRHLPDGDQATNLREAIACYGLAMEVHTRDAFPTDWAMIQNNLGNAWSDMPDGDRAANLRTAIECYERALTVYTSAAFPYLHEVVSDNSRHAQALLDKLG